jgi:hypothetical protein
MKTNAGLIADEAGAERLRSLARELLRRASEVEDEADVPRA